MISENMKTSPENAKIGVYAAPVILINGRFIFYYDEIRYFVKQGCEIVV